MLGWSVDLEMEFDVNGVHVRHAFQTLVSNDVEQKRATRVCIAVSGFRTGVPGPKEPVQRLAPGGGWLYELAAQANVSCRIMANGAG